MVRSMKLLLPFAYGRENLVPIMFTRILDACQVTFKTGSSIPLLSGKTRIIDGE